jgi:hypothetical protein
MFSALLLPRLASSANRQPQLFGKAGRQQAPADQYGRSHKLIHWLLVQKHSISLLCAIAGRRPVFGELDGQPTLFPPIIKLLNV